MVKVLIIGAGFGGLNAAKAFKGKPFNVLLLDKTNHHVFQPLLYQVATAALSVGNIASPIREILRNQENIEVLMEEVVQIDKTGQRVFNQNGKSYYFDYLIVAPGATHSYFGHDEWEKDAPGLKTIVDGERLREKILLAFEKAECCDSPKEAQKYLNFVVVGAGPTGVEMAGSIAEFAKRTLFKNFRHINPANSKVYLIEGAGQVLPSFSPRLGGKAQEYLEELGVEVLLNSVVTQVSSDGIYMGDRFLECPTVVWAAGNQASPLLKTLQISLDKQGRAIVNQDLSIPGQPNIFVIGDAALSLDDKGEPLPGIAPVAIQQGRYVANLILENTPVEKRKPFAYFDKGMISTIRGGKAVAKIGRFEFTGFFAWLIWCFIHILYLVSFRNRILIMTQWMFLYLLGRRQERIINDPIERIPDKNDL